MIEQAPKIFLALTIGGVIVGIPTAVAGYFFCYSVVESYQKSIKEK